MAAAVESRTCTVCGCKYRTKVRRGQDARPCPDCTHPKPEVAPEPEPKTEALNLVDVIWALGEAPEGELNPALVRVCKDYTTQREEPLRFLRNLLDISSRYSWASDHVKALLTRILEDYPRESEMDKRMRREDLLDVWEPRKRRA